MLLRANKFRKDKESDCRRNELGSRIFVGRVFVDYAKCLHFYPSFSYGRIIAGEKITLQQLADAAHISTTYLHRIFRTQLGMTPGNYLAKIRIEESKLLLRDGPLSMGEISLRMGFSSQQHFSRQFRTVAGMTPSEYVRTLR